MLISVIIPALNEQSVLARSLDAWADQSPPIEVIVADGGSTDGTIELATGRARVVRARRGRACQMNAGARSARGDVLWFMHADSLPPDSAADAVREAVRDGAGAGTFRLRFDRAGPFLACCARCTHLSARSIAFGDRGLFVRSALFDRVGGYADMALFEDLEIVKRMIDSTEFRFMPQTVTTSARRFERNGAVRQQLLNATLWIRYQLGCEVESLAGRYPPPGGNTDERSPARLESS